MTRPNGLLVAILFLTAAGAGIYTALEALRLPISSVRIAGSLSHVDRQALRVAVETRIAGGFFQVDVDAVRRGAMSIPWVREASVRRIWPDCLHVAVIEREAVARWQGSGLLDEDGSLFEPDKSTYPAGLPELHGPTGTQTVVLKQLESLRKAFDEPGWRIARLILSDRRVWTATLGNGMEFVLGPAERGEDLRRVVFAIAAVLGDQMDKVDRIDLRYANGFSVRWIDTDAAKG